MSLPTPILQYNLAEASVKGLLPEGYTPLAYIESTGTLWIDTEISAGSSENVLLEMTVDNSVCTAGEWCGINGHMLLYIDSNGFSDGQKTFYNFGKSFVSYHILGDGYSVLNVNNSSSPNTRSWGTNRDPYNIYIANMSNFSQTTKVQIKIYTVFIWKSNALVADLRPARRDSDGVLGMYDLVSKTFKTNAGTGTFIAGPELAVGKSGGKSLPEEYLLVEYLENINMSYIDTGLLTTSGHTLKYETEILAFSGNYTGALSGGYFGLNGNYWGFGGVATSVANDTTKFYNISTLFIVQSASQTMYNYINGVAANVTRSNEIESARHIYIFALEGTTYTILGRIRVFKIYDNNTLTRHFIPCYRKSDMKPGMYDVVNGVFYTNAGSREFILGPTVTNYYSCEVSYKAPNLCTYSPDLEITLNNYQNTGSFTQFTNDKFTISDYSQTVGKTYTVSFDAISPNGTSALLVYNNNNTPRYFYYDKSLGNVTTSWQHYSYTFTSADRGSGNAVSHPVEIYAPSKMGVKIKNLSIYEGSTDWSTVTRDGLYTNISGIYNSSKGWVALFNGSNSKLHSHCDLVSMFNSRVWSISFWMNPGVLPTSSDPSVWKRIFIYRKAGESDSMHKQLVVFLTKTGIGTSFYSDDTEKTIPGLAINNWYHIVITQNGETSTVYANGTSLGTMSKSTLSIPTGSYLQIGYDSDRNKGAFSGKLSNIMIFDSVLTEAQVKELYGQ